MKKILYFLLGLAAAVALSSCVKEPTAGEADPALGGIPVQVTFHLNLGSDLTKAATTDLDDGSKVDQVYAAVFAKDGSLISSSRIGGTGYQPTASISGGSASLTLTLSRSQDYKVIFFAQKQGMYDVQFAPGNVATFSPRSGALANDPARDAFWAAVDVNSSVSTYNVTLRRPFAQINVLVPEDNLPAGKTALSSTMTVTGMASGFDLFAGKSLDGTAEMSFAEQAISTAAFGKYASGYRWVAMNYVLVPASGRINLSFKEKDMASALSLSGITVSANGRTNLVGRLYPDSGDGDVDCSFTVRIDSGIEGGGEQDTPDTPDNPDTPSETPVDTEIVIADGATYTEDAPLEIDASASQTMSVTLTVNGDSFQTVHAGASGQQVTAVSDHPEVVTAAVSGNDVVITPVGNGDAVVTVSTPAYTKASYKAATFRIPVRVTGVADQSDTPEGDRIYQRVTDLSDLTAGSEVLLVVPAREGQSYDRALGTWQSSNYRLAANVTIEGDRIANPVDTAAVFTLIAGGEANSLAFQTADGRFLYDASGSSSNYLRTTADGTVSGAASFAVALGGDGTAVIRSFSDVRKYIQYNATNDFFSCYAHTQVDPVIYKLVGSGEGSALVIPVAATPRIVCEDNQVTITSETAGAEIFYTLDGSEPTTASYKYSGAFDITESCTVSAIAVAEGYARSDVASAACAYKAADTRDVTFDFTDIEAHGLGNWPTTNEHENPSAVYAHENGTNYVFGLTSYIRINSTNYGTYLMLSNKAANDKLNPYNQILTLPAVDGQVLSAITVTAPDGASASAAASIRDADGNVVADKQTLARGAETTFVIPASVTASPLQIYVEGTYNAQIAGLTLSYAAGGSGTTAPAVTTGGASAVTTTTATLSGTFSGMAGGVRDYGIRWGTSATALTQEQGFGSSTQSADAITVPVSSLSASTTYYYQAFAIDETTLTEYAGEVKSFTTEAEQSQTGNLPVLGRYEIPAIPNLKSAAEYETGPETFGSTNWYSFETTGSMQRVVQHTYADGSETRVNYTTLVDGTRYAPLWTAFEMSTDYPDNDEGRNDSWTVDPAVPAEWQQTGLQNASTVGYSRGHFCASNYRQATTFANNQTFYYTNQAPQWQNNFNGGVWSTLEQAVVKNTPTSDLQKLYVVVGVIYDDNPKTLPSGSSDAVSSKQVPIPMQFYKLIMKCTFNASGTMTDASGVAYLFTNEAHANAKPADGITTIDAVEALTGFDFFANVPASLQNAAEAQAQALW